MGNQGNDEAQKDFDLGAILSITTKRLVANPADTEKVIKYLFGGETPLLGLVAVRNIARRHILKLYPDLEYVVVDKINSAEEAQAFVERQKANFGETLALKPIQNIDTYLDENQIGSDNEPPYGIHRYVVKTTIDDEDVSEPIKAGERLTMDEDDFDWLKSHYPKSIVEIHMSEQECLQYLSSEAHKWYQRVLSLSVLCAKAQFEVPPPLLFAEKTASLGTIATKGSEINPKDYGDAISDIVKKVFCYIEESKSYEEYVYSMFNEVFDVKRHVII